MPTTNHKCRIAIINSDNTITSIHCESAGEPSYTGRILEQNYTSRELADKLIDLGDLLAVGAKPELRQEGEGIYYLNDKEAFEKCVLRRIAKHPMSGHNNTLEEFLNNAKHAYGYAYVFDNNSWRTYELTA